MQAQIFLKPFIGEMFTYKKHSIHRNSSAMVINMVTDIKQTCLGQGLGVTFTERKRPNNDLCTVYKNSECCGEAAPAATGILCNHQCVVSMRQKMLPVCCNKNSSIKLLLVYQEKTQSSNRFLDVISWEYDNSCS